MKIYARQIPPEYQESPLFRFEEDFPDDIAVFGNSNYKEHMPDFFEHVLDVLNAGELSELLESEKELKQWHKNKTECIMSYIPPIHKSKYSTKEISCLVDFITNYPYCGRQEKNYLCKIVGIVTGKKWFHKTIRGCCQSDWNEIYYPDTYTREQIHVFETEYWNEGTEWIIHEGENEPESIDDIFGYSFYCYNYLEKDIKKEIADSIGAEAEDVVLYAFDRWNKVANYNIV